MTHLFVCIVASTAREPCPGLVENFSGPVAIVFGIGSGLMRSLNCNFNALVDLIPVDVVSNAILAAAWHQAVIKPSALTVFNCVSCNQNPITYKSFFTHVNNGVIEYPNKNAIWYPADVFKQRNSFEILLKHTIPAWVADRFLQLFGKPPQ